MNRAERRRLAKKLRADGDYTSDVSTLASLIRIVDDNPNNMLSGVIDAMQQEIFGFEEDCKVMLDVEEITSRKDFETKLDDYKQFVLENKDTVFTAHVEHGRLISLKENPTWLFTKFDLIKLDTDGEESKEGDDSI